MCQNTLGIWLLTAAVTGSRFSTERNLPTATSFKDLRSNRASGMEEALAAAKAFVRLLAGYTQYTRTTRGTIAVCFSVVLSQRRFLFVCLLVWIYCL